MTDAMVRFSGVSKGFGASRGAAANRVLCDIDLELAPGSFLGLVGINGAGKTTLIKCLLDFCDLDGGRIEIHGRSWRDAQARARLAYLPERFAPPYFLRGREFIGAMLRLSQQPWDEARVRAMFAALELDAAALERPVRAYSKGMTQKLGLAACLLSGRDLLVLDEPMSGLDPSARARAKSLLAALRERGSTLLLTSHSLADIDEICDHMAVLHRGRIAFAGAPSELRERHGEVSLESAFLKCIDAAHG